ncbi:hypothetical protein [Thermus hydrothermalis]|uniref:hypothetical protein n=1 Tax=Thermus hydrothermalis TaxID=2908148 RepID=UPI001FAAAA09|nr:hypothetical protein [Thermus hydrothermalis]
MEQAKPPPFQAILLLQGVASPPKGPGHFPSVQVLDRTYRVPGNGLAPKARAGLPGVLQAFLRRNPGGGPVPVLLYPRTEGCSLDLGKTLLAKIYTTEPPPLAPGRFRVVGLLVDREGQRLRVEVRPNPEKGTLGEAFTLCLRLAPGLADAPLPLGRVLDLRGRLEEDLSLLVEEAQEVPGGLR